MRISFEETLAYHCAPALAGIKSADLISWMASPEELSALVGHYETRLSGSGIRIRPLCRKNGRYLLLVYRQPQLERQLNRPAVRELLARDGYPVEMGTEALLRHLSRRLKGESFPHEVGLFLGYPPEDVEGFRRNKGRNFKYCGCWKVYTDVESACRCFQQYDRCRSALLKKVSQGRSITQLFCAA